MLFDPAIPKFHDSLWKLTTDKLRPRLEFLPSQSNLTRKAVAEAVHHPELAQFFYCSQQSNRLVWACKELARICLRAGEKTLAVREFGLGVR